MDENKIEITVELDTSKAEKQADNLNDALVDGAKDANKEFKKYSDSVNKNLNSIKKQMDNTFNGAKMANSLTSKVGKALNGIKNKINSILGNINVNANLNANVNSSNQQNGSNGASLGGAIVGGSAVGAMLSKTQALNKVVKDTRDIIKDQKTSLQHTKNAVKENMKWNATMDNISDVTTEIVANVDGIDGVFYDTVVTVDKMSTVMKDFRKNVDIKDVLSSNTMELGKARKIANELQNTLTVMNGVDSSFNGGGRFADELARLDELMFSLQKMSKGMNFGEKLIPQSALAEIQALVGITNQATSRFNIFKTQAVEALVSVERKCPMIGKAMSTIGSGFNKVVAKGKELGQTFKQGFQESQKYIDNMKAKIQEWADNHKKATDKVKNANKSVGGSFKSLLSQILPFASIYGIFNGLKTSITSFVDGLQQSGKFATVFGNETQKMTEWLDEINSKVAMSKSDIMDFSSTLYRMGKNMGVSTDDAMAMAKSMTELGADLVAFTNDANSIEALAGALRGEYDSLQNYGYSLSASAVEARALAMGLDSASESALMMARQSLILEQSGDVLGYASGQAQTLSGQMAMLRKNFQALGTAIGSCFAGLLQIVLPVLNAIIKAVTVAFSKLASLINGMFSAFGFKIGGSSGGISNSFGDLSNTFGDVADSSNVIADNFGEANKDAKEMAKNLASFDKLNVLNTNTSSGSSSNSGSNGSIGGGTIGSIGSMGGNAPSYNKATVEIEGWAKDLGKRIHDAIVNNPYFKSLKNNFFGLADACKSFIKSAGSWLKLFMDNGGRDFLNNLGDCAFIIGDILITALKDGVTWITNFLNSAKGQAVIKSLAEMCKWLSERLKDILLWIRENKDMLYKLIGVVATVKLGFSAFIKVAQGISAIKTGVGLVKTALSKLPTILKGVKGAWETMKIAGLLALDKIKLAFPSVLAGAKSMLTGAVSAIGSAISAVATALGISSGALVAIIAGVIAVLALVILNWDKVKEFGVRAWQKTKEVWSTSNQWCYNNIVSPMINHFRNLWTKARDLGQRAFDGIKNTWQGMGAWYGSLGQRVSQHFSTMWQNIKNGGQNAWQYLQRVFNSGGSFFRDITSGMGNAFKSVLNVAIKGINNVIAYPFNGINNAIRKLRNATVLGMRPFSFLREISVPKIPYLAKGGIVDSATLALIGEGRQNEAVVPLDTFYSRLSQMFAEQNRMLMQNMQNGNGNATIILQMDGKEVARGTVSNMREMSRLGQLDMTWL